jgi:tripartite-type tricarboxylate transporter receptor subunit TctC
MSGFSKIKKETPMITRRLLTGSLIASPFVALAQSFPQTVRLVVGWPPGGSTDFMARVAQPALQAALGVNVIIENKPGASGAIAAGQVAKAPNDGSQWLFVFDTQGVNPTLIPNLSFDHIKDLDPVSLIGTAPMTIACQAEKPYKSFQDVIASSKANNGVNYGSIATGSLGHLAMTLYSKKTGVVLNHIPYRGGGPLTNDVLAGHVDLGIASAAQFASHVAGGKMRALAQTGATRVPTMKDVPTIAESGFAGFEAYAWWGVFAPAGTPKALVDKVNAGLVAAYNEPKIKEQIINAQQVDLKVSNPDALREFYKGQVDKWASVIKENNIKATD